MGIFKRIGTFINNRQTTRLASKQKRLETRQAGKTDRKAVGAAAQSDRDAIAASAGFNPIESSTGDSKLSNFFGKAKDVIGGLLGGGSSAADAPTSGDAPKDKTMLYVIGGLGVAALLFFGLKKKK